MADKEILFAGQPVGIVIAKTQKIANTAADKVVVNIAKPRQAVIDFVKVVESGDQTRIFKDAEKPATKSKSESHFTLCESLLVVYPLTYVLAVYIFSLHNYIYMLPIPSGTKMLQSRTKWHQPTYIKLVL